jgi:hypothetical protein
MVCALAAQVFLIGCGSSNSKPDPTGRLSGNWQITLQGEASSRSQAGFVLQAGKSLTGQFLLTGDCAGVGGAQGQMNGTNVSLTVNQPAQTVGLTGNVGTDGSSITGNYSILSSGCGASETGTWTATRIQALSGSLTGSFVSNFGGTTPFNFSGTLAQGMNTGSTHADISGSMTSTDAICFSNASISGVISGASVALNFSSSEGVSFGQFSGTASADAKTVTGTYDFFNAQTPIPGCPAGDAGAATLTVQPQP